MSELDPKGLEAAWMAFKLCDSFSEHKALTDAIAAYEAHKASGGYRWVKFRTASPPPFQYDFDDEAHKASAVSRPPTDAVGYKEGDVVAIASAVPEEDLIRRLRWPGGSHSSWFEDMRRAADLLEQLAKTK